jgi:hypothetical protein
VRALTAQEVIVELLRSYNEVCGPGERGEGADACDDRILMMSPLWREGSYAELYRCLYEMRQRERALYWHVAERYLRLRQRRAIGCPECRQETREGVRHTHFANGARTRFERQPFLQDVWHPGVELRKVDAGIDWLVHEHRGTPYLPREIFLLVAS